MAWEEELEAYRAQQFLVVTRDMLQQTTYETVFQGLVLPAATRRFVEELTRPERSLWEAFFAGIQSVWEDMQEQEVFLEYLRIGWESYISY